MIVYFWIKKKPTTIWVDQQKKDGPGRIQTSDTRPRKLLLFEKCPEKSLLLSHLQVQPQGFIANKLYISGSDSKR